MQEVKTICLGDLVLWTENPRDPIDMGCSDVEIIRRAIKNDSKNWNLDKMLENVGEEYYYNDLPTVVENSNRTYTVYDGNRRVALLKCIQNPVLYSEATSKLACFVSSDSLMNQTVLPCNVCDRETALNIVEKYHKSSGKWGKLQYEYFLHIHRGHPKGRLILLNEAGDGLVERNPKLNEEYVQSSLLTDANLNSIGFAIVNNELVTNLSNEDAVGVLEDIAEVRNQDISNARKNPRRLRDALIELNPEKYKKIEAFKESHPIQKVKTSESSTCDFISGSKRVPLKKRKNVLFGGVIRPRGDKSNQIYRAVDDIYREYSKKPEEKAYLLPIIGFSLRLFLETVAQEYFAAQNPPIDKGDQTLTYFLGKRVKPYFRNNCKQLLNQYSLVSEWVSGNINLEGILGKWAHGTLAVDNDTIVRNSKLIAEIVREFWWKD